jgi:hypothetical protein
MKFHILTPFNREENKDLILENFRRPNVIFHPLIDRKIQFPKESWIKPFNFTPDPGIRWVVYHAWNKFLGSGLVVDKDYYMFLSDDDFLEPDFFEKIQDIKTDIILVSMKRGDNALKSGSANTLTPSPHFVRSRIGTEQLIIKGEVLKAERFIDLHTADYVVIGGLRQKYPQEKFTYATNAFVWFNYLEPGRWNSAPSPK